MSTWVDRWTDSEPGAVTDEVAQALKREQVWKARGQRKGAWRSLGNLENLKKANAKLARRRGLAHDWNEGVPQ